MELLSKIKEIFMQSKEFIQTNNYYFEKHACDAEPSAGETVKVDLDTVIKDDKDNEYALRVGMCPRCKRAFYYYGAK